MTGASGTQGYGENAAALADQYESIAFADVHRDVAHLIPAAWTPTNAARACRRWLRSWRRRARS
jgi:hypothetical protein